MFSGIVDHIGTLESSEARGDTRIAVACDFKNLVLGESIAVNGVCLTVVESLKNGFLADVSAETLRCTAPSGWKKWASVNLERALKMGDAISGHMVTGHVDGVAKLLEVTPSGDSHVLGFEAPKPLAKFIAEKGSVTLDGVSLTVNKVEGSRFWVNIIPHTQTRTTLGKKQPGDVLNLEVDIIARYVERLAQK
jgi:riboflavin synthase